MGHVKIKTSIELTDNKGFTKKYDYVYNNTVLNSYSSQLITVGASTTKIIWDPTTWTDYNITDFDYLALISNTELYVELTVNEGESTEEMSTFQLSKDLPFMLGSDDAYYNHSASDAFAGTLDVIDKIRVKEVNGNNATVHMILFT
jgi:hypothetical protein